MKVEIDENGMMHISSETALESYALDKWCDDNLSDGINTKNITIRTGLNQL